MLQKLSFAFPATLALVHRNEFALPAVELLFLLDLPFMVTFAAEGTAR